MGRDRRGVGALEFALTLPFLLLVLVGVIELSWLMHRSHVVARITSDAARVGAGVVEGVAPTGDAIEAAAVEHAEFALAAAGIACGGRCRVEADWSERDDWMMLRVVVGTPHEPLTRLGVVGAQNVMSDFVVLTRQQRIAEP